MKNGMNIIFFYCALFINKASAVGLPKILHVNLFCSFNPSKEKVPPVILHVTINTIIKIIADIFESLIFVWMHR